MDIKKYIKNINKINPFTVLVTGFGLGLVVMYLYLQPKLADQTKKTNNWQNTANKNQTLINQNQAEIISYKEQIASTSAQIKTLLSKPPQVEYKTQYVENPNDTSTESYCYPDGSGGEWCRSNGGNTQHCMYYGTLRKCN